MHTKLMSGGETELGRGLSLHFQFLNFLQHKGIHILPIELKLFLFLYVRNERDSDKRLKIKGHLRLR